MAVHTKNEKYNDNFNNSYKSVHNSGGKYTIYYNMHWFLQLKCSTSVNWGGFWLPKLLSLYHLEQIILKVIPAVLFLGVVIVWTFLFSQH